MSTILKALKKLEQETQSAGTAAAFQTLSDRPADPPAPARNRLWAGIGIGASLAGLGLVLFFLLRPAAPPASNQPQSQPVPAAPPKVATAPADRLPMPKVFPPRKPGDPEPVKPSQVGSTNTEPSASERLAAGKSAPQTAVAPEPAAQRPAPPTPPAQKPAKEVPSQPPMVAEAPSEALPSKTVATPAPEPELAPKATPMATPGIAPATEPPQPPTEPAQATPAPQPSPSVAPAKPASPPPRTKPTVTASPQEAPAQKPLTSHQPAATESQPASMTEKNLPKAPVDPYANVPKLEENSPINLQAISWVEAAGESIVVINNSVLHEGDSVEGYSVVKIRPDDVILRREGRMWRANFSIR